MATILLLYQAVPVMDKKPNDNKYKKSSYQQNQHSNTIQDKFSNNPCSCNINSNNSTPEILKKISSSLAGQLIDRSRRIPFHRDIPRGTHRKQWKSQAKRQLDYPDKNVKGNVDDHQDAESVMEHWLGVGRDLRYLADCLTDATQTAVTTQVPEEAGHQNVWSVDFSSTSNLFYSLVVLAVLKKLCKLCKLTFLL